MKTRISLLNMDGKRFLRLAANAAALLLSVDAPAQSATVELSFSEASGGATTNSGSLGGSGVLVQTDGRPVFSNRVPVGAFAPSNNAASVDFGDIAAGQGGRAIDLTTAVGDGSLGAFTAFTVCGWLNARSLNEGFGGNRVAFVLASPDGPGFDLVQTSGSLRIGINQWPDGGGGGGPTSSAGVITADPNTGTNNWVFFAVTYDSAPGSGQFKYYFGKHTQAAALSTTHTYARGPVTTSGRLTLGNFGCVIAARNELGPGGGSRVFRGLIDEVRVFSSALTLAEVQTAQTSGSFIPVNEPPVMAQLMPGSNATVRVLRQLEVVFSEAVHGVDAADLIVNGAPATNVVTVSPADYVFQFPDAAHGAVTFSWAVGHGIRDTWVTPADFAGGSWTNVVDPSLLPAPPIISEFMADNDNTLADEDGDNPDWIEIYNPDSEPLNLEGFLLADSVSRWRFPAVTMAGLSYLLVLASEKDRTNPSAPLHTNFRLERSGEHLALLDPQTNVLSEFAPFYPTQVEDVSYGRDRLSPEITGYFTVPTSGRANSTSGAGFASEVQFSAPSGSFTTPFELTLAGATPGAVIRYILVNTAATASNTNVPGTNSPIYTVPLQITNTVQVRARAFAPGLLPGPPASETYVRLDTNVLARSSDLPLVVVHTLGGGAIAQSAFKNAHVSIYETKYGRAALASEPDVTTRAALRVRGNTSASSPKQSWSLELRDEFDRDFDQSLLGMPAESDWALYGPNAIDTVMSNPARLTVLVDTMILVPPPASITAVTGGTFAVSVAALGNPLPFGYEWRQGSTTRASNTVNGRFNFTTFTAPATFVTNQIWRIVVRNPANQSTAAFAQFLVNTHADSDGDGISDDWELTHGFDPGSGLDGDDDEDGDTMSNLAEYLAGTDPTNRLSCLKVEASLMPGAASVSFLATSNRTYSVQYSDVLPAITWSNLSHVIARPATRVEVIADPVWTTNRFYRLVLPAQP